MSPEQVSGLLTAFGGLLGVLLWPALIVFIALHFKSEVRNLLSADRLTFKAPGVEASFQRNQVEAAAALGAASVKDGLSGGSTSSAGIAGVLADAVPDARAQQRLRESHVLWVDDRPQNNQYERQALEALGIRFRLAESTDQAMELIRQNSFDLIISDMGRPPDPRAGYTLLDKLRESGDRTPLIFYAASRLPEHVQESREHGALGCTNRPQELILMVSGALGVRTRG